jgi:hypothetical protein
LITSLRSGCFLAVVTRHSLVGLAKLALHLLVLLIRINLFSLSRPDLDGALVGYCPAMNYKTDYSLFKVVVLIVYLATIRSIIVHVVVH